MHCTFHCWTMGENISEHQLKYYIGNIAYTIAIFYEIAQMPQMKLPEEWDITLGYYKK